MCPINIVPSQILIENFNQVDVYQSIVEVTNRQTHSIRLKVSLSDNSGFKIVDVIMPKIHNQAVGTLAPGMAMKVHVIFKAEADHDISAKIDIQVESFNDVQGIPCNATNRPPLLKQLGVDKQNEHVFQSGMCWVGERIDSVFRVQNEGGSCQMQLKNLDSHKQPPSLYKDMEPVMRRHREDLLNLEENHPKLQILQGFKGNVDKKSSLANPDGSEDDDKKETQDTPRMSMRHQEPIPLEAHPFAVIPSEFFLEGDSYIDIYVIFNPKVGEFASRSIGFFHNNMQVSQFELNGVGLQVNLAYSMQNNQIMNKTEQLELENVQFNDIELNKFHIREFAVQNYSPLPVKVKWDMYNKENPYIQSACQKISIMPNELVIGPEAEQTFTLKYTPDSYGYDIYTAILNVENIHTLALSKSKVINDINDSKFKQNLVGNTTHVTLPQFKVDIECFVRKNQVELKNDVAILQNPVTIFEKNVQKISIHNPSSAQVVIRISEFLHHDLVLVGCQELDLNQGLVISPLETKDITIRQLPQITGESIITTILTVEGGESVTHEYSFKICGPDVSVANINSLVVDVKPNLAKKFPVTLKNNSNVDAEVLFLYKDHNNYQFNYHQINDSIKDQQQGFDTQHKNNIVEQLGLQTVREDQKLDSMVHSSQSRKKLSEKGIVEKQTPKFFNTSSLVNSISKNRINTPCIYESHLELDNISEPQFIIPPKSSIIINVKVNTQFAIESEFLIMTKQSVSKTIPVNIGIDTRIRKNKTNGNVTPSNINNSNLNMSNNLSQNQSFNSSRLEDRIIKDDIKQLPIPEKTERQSRNASQTYFKTKNEVLKEPQFDSKYNDYSKLFK